MTPGKALNSVIVICVSYIVKSWKIDFFRFLKGIFIKLKNLEYMATNTNRIQAFMAAEREKNFRITLHLLLTLTYVKHNFYLQTLPQL